MSKFNELQKYIYDRVTEDHLDADADYFFDQLTNEEQDEILLYLVKYHRDTILDHCWHRIEEEIRKIIAHRFDEELYDGYWPAGSKRFYFEKYFSNR